MTKPNVSRANALLIFVASLVGLAVLGYLYMNGTAHEASSPYLPWGFSILDYAVGVLTAVNIVAAALWKPNLATVAAPVRAFAGSSFSLYLYHMPILHFVAVLLSLNLSPSLRWTIQLMVVLVVVALLAPLTEGQRFKVKLAIQWVVLWISPSTWRRRAMSG